MSAEKWNTTTGLRRDRAFSLTAIAMLASAVALGAQAVKDEEVVWRDFINWYKAAPPSGMPPPAHAARSRRRGH
mgnify:CR=1 FL=1